MDPEVLNAIAKVVEAGRSLGQEPILIGALASALAPGRPSGLPATRASMDADFAVAVRSWEDYKVLRATLVTLGHRPDPHIEHRMYVGEVKVDLVPFGPGVAPDGTHLTWPDSELRMDLTGFEEATAAAQEVTILPGVTIRCVTIPGFVILKISALLDRHARGDLKFKSDAEDVAFWFRHYASDDDDRKFDVMAGAEVEIDFEFTGAAVLGVDVAGLASVAAKTRIQSFLAVAPQDDGPFLIGINRPSFDEDDRNRAMTQAKHFLRAFDWGFRKPSN